jgi:hypothetical protein
MSYFRAIYEHAKSMVKPVATLTSAALLYANSAYAKPTIDKLNAQFVPNNTEIEISAQLSGKNPVRYFAAFDPSVKPAKQIAIDSQGNDGWNVRVPVAFAGKELILAASDGKAKTDRTTQRYTLPTAPVSATTPEATKTPTPEKTPEPKPTKTPGVPSNNGLYGDVEVRSAYDSVNASSKTPQGTNVLDMTSQGSGYDVDLRSKIGMNFNNENYAFIPLELLLASTDVKNSIASIPTLESNAKDSVTNIGVGLGYGRNFGQHHVALSVVYDIFNETLEGKHDIVNFKRTDSASDIRAVLDYVLHTQKGNELFRMRYDQLVASLGGESVTDVTIPSIPGFGTSTTKSVLRNGAFMLEGTLYVPTPFTKLGLIPMVRGSLEHRTSEVDTAGSIDTSSVTRLGGDAGLQYQKGNFAVQLLGGMRSNLSGVASTPSNSTDLARTDVRVGLNARYNFGFRVEPKSTTPTAKAAEPAAKAEPTPAATPAVTPAPATTAPAGGKSGSKGGKSGKSGKSTSTGSKSK